MLQQHAHGAGQVVINVPTWPSILSARTLAREKVNRNWSLNIEEGPLPYRINLWLWHLMELPCDYWRLSKSHGRLRILNTQLLGLHVPCVLTICRAWASWTAGIHNGHLMRGDFRVKAQDLGRELAGRNGCNMWTFRKFVTFSQPGPGPAAGNREHPSRMPCLLSLHLPQSYLTSTHWAQVGHLLSDSISTDGNMIAS